MSMQKSIKTFRSSYDVPHCECLAEVSVRLSSKFYPIGLTMVNQVLMLFCYNCQSLLTLGNCIEHYSMHAQVNSPKSPTSEPGEIVVKDFEVNEEDLTKLKLVFNKYHDYFVMSSGEDTQTKFSDPYIKRIYEKSLEDIVLQIPLMKALSKDEILSCLESNPASEPIRGLPLIVHPVCCGKLLKTEKLVEQHKRSCNKFKSGKYTMTSYQKLEIDGKVVSQLFFENLDYETLAEQQYWFSC